mgnify:CR=1 FL=1
MGFLTAIGGFYTWWAYKNRGATPAVRGLAFTLLPAAAWGEKDGTVTNSERRISRQRPFLALPGEARPDWWIVTQVARRMGFSEAFPYRCPGEIFAEHVALSAFENGGTPKVFESYRKGWSEAGRRFAGTHHLVDEQRALARILADHTYRHRAEDVGGELLAQLGGVPALAAVGDGGALAPALHPDDVLGDGADDWVVRLIGLKDGAAHAIAATSSAGGLAEELIRPFRGALIGQVQRDVR